ncbi:MAG: hypothetical protein K6E27_00075 [Eubacterium sp.]|nr:hypothetical protein [Eubacterium sp.]
MGNAENILFKDGEWTIELRPRNNFHEGEPTVKVWVLREAQEVAQYTDKYRGYGAYKDNEELLPADITSKAKSVWDKLKETPFSQELVAEIREELSK